MIDQDDIAYSEYAVEVYEKGTDRFCEQIDVLSSEEEARQFIEDAGPIPKNYYYGVLQINYDANGDEISTERL